MDKISTCLWFDDEAAEAVDFYIKVFGKGRVTDIAYYDESTNSVSKKPAGSVLTVSFKLFGRDFMALNGGPEFKFNSAVSFIVDCKDQKEVDRYWQVLTEGGQEVACGWLTDKYGLSWQIVPREFVKLSRSKERKKVVAMNAAMMKMKKLDMPALKKAFMQGEQGRK